MKPKFRVWKLESWQ